jgi:small conductance mechanosensitive channel
MNILIVLAEVGLIILVSLVLRWLVGNLFKLLIRLSILKGDDIKIKILRRNIIKSIS